MRELEVRPGRREGAGWQRRKSGMQTGRDGLKAVGARTRAKRTENMKSMVVTLEVSQLDMSALKFCTTKTT